AVVARGEDGVSESGAGCLHQKLKPVILPNERSRMARQEQAPRAQPGEVIAKALVRAARRLGLSQGDVAEVIGTSAASMSRTFAGERPIGAESAEGRHALLLLRVYRSLDTLVGGDVEKARAWLS